MKPTTECITALATKIAEVEIRLQKLEWEIEEIGQPAAHELKHRLQALKTEEIALKRNLSEVMLTEDPDGSRMPKVEALLAYIEREEVEVRHDADFLHQSPPTSAEYVAQAGSQVLELCLRAIKRVLGNHHPLGSSVFVNHSHELLAKRYGLAAPEVDRAPPADRDG